MELLGLFVELAELSPHTFQGTIGNTSVATVVSMQEEEVKHGEETRLGLLLRRIATQERERFGKLPKVLQANVRDWNFKFANVGRHQMEISAFEVMGDLQVGYRRGDVMKPITSITKRHTKVVGRFPRMQSLVKQLIVGKAISIISGMILVQ